MIGALKRTRWYQRYRQARGRRRLRSRKGLARSLERVLLNHDAVLRALTHLVERTESLAAAAERRDQELNLRLERLEHLVVQQGEGLGRLADRVPEPLDHHAPTDRER